jgi:ATP-dependent RNA helicase DeaD
MTFDDVNPSLARALAEQGYKEPTPVQSAVLESGSEDRDLLVSAQTGSGKTVAYGLAIAPTILGAARAWLVYGPRSDWSRRNRWPDSVCR